MQQKLNIYFFYKLNPCDSIPLRLPTITFNSIKIKRESSVKFVRVIIDENTIWNKHIELVENKISKNIGILYRAPHYLDKKSLKSIYFSFIYNYLNYYNTVLASPSTTKLDNVLKKQKHAVRTIYNKDKFTQWKPLMRDMKALNVYQINIFLVLKFMYKSKHNLNPRVFDNTFTEIYHGYPTRFSRSNFKQPEIITKTNSFVIFFTWS